MTIKEIANMSYFDIRKMDKDEMYKLLRYAKAQSDKRITNYYKANEPGKKGIYARTIENFLENKNGKFKGRLNVRKTMTRNEMLSEISRVQKLFSSETGTVRGARQLRKKTITRLTEQVKTAYGEKYSIKANKELSSWSETEWKAYWKAYDRFMDEQGGRLGTLYSSRELQDQLIEAILKPKGDKMFSIYEKILEEQKERDRIVGDIYGTDDDMEYIDEDNI